MHRQRGFSLIELMITVGVIILLALLAIPSMRQYMENSKILAVAETLYTSVQQARTEAIRRNNSVELVFTDQAPSEANAGTTGLTTSGPNWMTRAAPPGGAGDYTFISGKAAGEGGGAANGGTSLVIDASANAIQFNALGELPGASTITVDISHVGATCAPTGPARCLRVEVFPGGQTKLCDPAATGASDSRRC